MFKLSHRNNLLRTSLLGVVIVAILSTAAYFIVNHHQGTNATKTGDSVKITKKDGVGDLYYGDHQTHWYLVTNNTSNKTYTGYCAEPKKDSPVGNKTATSLSGGGKYDQIKLIIYIREQTDDTAITDLRNNIFSSIKNDSDWGTSETYRIYAFTHAVLGAMYGGDWEGLDSGMRAQVRSARDLIEAEINNSGVAWQHAQQYALFFANKTSTDDDQDVVWIEPTGSIIVQKCDAEITSQCIPQGNANFNNITFDLYDGSTKIASKTLSNGAQSVTFDHLNIDATYTVKESGSSNSYNLTASNQTATPTPAGTTVTFRNTVKKGKLTVNKIDKETGTCTNSGELSFAGTTLQLINNSTNPVYYNGSVVAKGSVVATRVFPANTCSVTFENLPYGAYQIKETVAATGYVLDSTPKDVTVPSNNSYDVEYEFANQPIRGDVKFVKMDENNERPMKNVLFSISSLDSNEQIRETHIVVTNEDGIIDTSSIHHSINTNGYDELYDDTANPIVFSGYGTWFGLDKNLNKLPVKDDLGALLYGTYIIQELRCDNNIFCTNIINQKHTIEVTEHNKVINLENWDNTCTKFTIETEATDNKDGDKIIEVTDEPIEIKDTVSYCAKKNYSFVIKGILMDKETGNPIKVNGENVEQSIEVKPKTDCGTVEMIYELDARDLAGKEIVVFESLYYRENLMTSHEEIDDENQTVELISLTTYATNESTGDKILPLDSDVRIKDTVKYCLKPGVEYTVKGVIMDKRTGNGLLINSEPIEQSATFTPQTACGEFDMFYDLNTTNLGGAELVIFESLYRDNELLLEHRNINNAAETVTVELPVPETGASTKTPNASQESSNLSTIIIIATSGIVIYTAIRFTAKKRFFRR